MLERTAACLEPCGLRVLPPHKKALRSTRQLHTTFWQHGAADIELTTAWQALMHGTVDANSALFEEARRGPSLSASAFLLDFLYPTGAVALMSRRLSPISPDRSDRLRFRTRPSHVSPRLYNSSLPRLQPESSSSDVRSQSHAARVNRQIRDGTPGHTPLSSIESNALEPLTPTDSHTHIVAIERILEREKFDDVDLLWRHYTSLDESSQNAHFHPVLAFLSRTGRVSDSWKISELFHRLDISNWDHSTFVAGVSAEISLQNLSQALSIFERGLRSTTLDNITLVDALDLLLASALSSSSTDFLQEIWKLYPEMAARWDFDGITADLTHSASVPSIAEKALVFPDYIAARLNDPSSAETDREALQVLQKILVRRALISCKDSQVTPLLLMTKDV
jgi:pentatricopeptide repeat-containing protein PET309